MLFKVDVMAKRYRVSGTVTGSVYIGEYEANSKEEAEALAEQDAHVSFCHQCGGNCESPEITELHVDEVDDEVEGDGRG